jgi:hypothetical protein
VKSYHSFQKHPTKFYENSFTEFCKFRSKHAPLLQLCSRCEVQVAQSIRWLAMGRTTDEPRSRSRKVQELVSVQSLGPTKPPDQWAQDFFPQG